MERKHIGYVKRKIACFFKLEIHMKDKERTCTWIYRILRIYLKKRQESNRKVEQDMKI